MEKEVEFDFSKRKDLESNIEPKITENTKKKINLAIRTKLKLKE